MLSFFLLNFATFKPFLKFAKNTCPFMRGRVKMLFCIYFFSFNLLEKTEDRHAREQIQD